jgi:hypothetical protein
MGVDGPGDRTKAPTDYTYDGSQAVTLDDHDRSKNDAHRLGGYELTITPDGGWPGLTPASKGITYRSDDMRAVAKWLRGKAEELRRVPADLLLGAGAVNFGPGSWAQAQHLKTASDMVCATVEQYSSSVLGNLEAAAAAIEAAADSYDKADHSSAARTDRVGSQIGS